MKIGIVSSFQTPPNQTMRSGNRPFPRAAGSYTQFWCKFGQASYLYLT
jgi:hypothetical protein